MNTSSWAWLALALVTLPACESASSGDIDTAGIWAQVQVSHDGDDRLKVSAELKTGRNSNTFLDLTDGDRLTARLGEDEPRTLDAHSVLNRIWYDTVFEGASDGVVVTIALDRVEKESALSSDVQMPPGFTLTHPTDGAIISAGDRVRVTWDDPGEDDFEISVLGDCIVGWKGSVPDTGRFELPLDTLEQDGTQPNCPVTVEAVRTRIGKADEALKGGEIRAWQVRRLQVQLDR